MKQRVENAIAIAIVAVLKLLTSTAFKHMAEFLGLLLLMTMGYLGCVIFYLLIWG